MKNTDFLKIQEKGEYKFINLGQVLYVTIREKRITFYLMKGPNIEYSESTLGEEEFKNLGEKFFPVASVSVV